VAAASWLRGPWWREAQRVFDLRQEKVNLATVAEFFKGAIFLVILRAVYCFVLFYVILCVARNGNGRAEFQRN